MSGSKVTMNLGYSHQINHELPDQVKVTVDKDTSVTIEGPDKQKVGMVAAELRGFYPVEPHKAKGVGTRGRARAPQGRQDRTVIFVKIAAAKTGASNMRTDKKRDLLKRRRWRIRKKVRGTVERPRMSVRMSNKNIYVQFIDDEAGHTLASVSSKAKSVENREKLSANVDSAKEIGKLAGEAAKAAGVETAVFDRNGARYHGK